MATRKYTDVRLIEGVHEAKMLELLNDGYEVLGMTSTVYGAVTHYILLAKRASIVTKLKNPAKVKSKD